jgi:Fanconi anemia group M protein
MNAFNIIVASRLKNNSVSRFLVELGTDVRHTTLRRGDFVLANRFGVKYLLRDEFIQAIKDRTIYREILEMKREYTDPIIIVEGEDPLHDPGLDLTTIHGVVLFASVINRVPILMAGNDIETAQMIFMMAAQSSKGIDWQKTADSRDTKGAASEVDDSGDPRVGIIARLPHVGPSLAEELLKHFGSLAKLFVADVNDLQKVDGIGPKKADKIFAFLSGDTTD